MSETYDKPRPGKLLVIIPAYNEAESIPKVLKDLRVQMPQADVVVIDDGSEDATGEIARQHGAAVLRLPCNLGVGGAMQTGYIYAARNGYDFAVQFDGDGQHRANQIPLLLDALADAPADLVVGSRRLSKKGLYRFDVFRLIGSSLLARLVSLIVGRKITDPTSGFRASNRKTIEFFARNYPQTYLADTTEALAWASRSGIRITEIPVRMRHRRSGSSATGSIKGVGHVLRIILTLLVDCLEGPLEKGEPKQ